MSRQTAFEKRELRNGFLRFLLRAGAMAGLFLVLFGTVFLLWRVEGQEMSPSARDGDLLVALRLRRTCHKNDVVIYQAEGRRLVGRIAAKEHDTVDVTKDGRLLVNGSLQTDHDFYQTEEKSEELPYTVPEGCVYILADKRTACRDSRDFGPIPVGKLEGTVIGLFRIRDF